MSDSVRMTVHPSDNDCVLVNIPVHLNGVARQLSSAQLAPDLHGYVMHKDSVPGLYRWGKFNGIHVIDDRSTQTRTALGPNPLPECANCGQPGSRTSPPKTCPGCGQVWTPVTFRDASPGAQRAECPSCRYRQSGKFPFCSQCGAAMVYPEPGEIPAFVAQLARPRLDDPMPLGDVMAGVLADHHPALLGPQIGAEQ